MFGSKWRLLAAVAAASVAGAGAVIAQTGETAPEARYYMDVGTTAGMMGQGDSHQLLLRLGSRLAATGGAPKADHFMPAGAKLGASVPLVSPEPAKATQGPTDPQSYGGWERPKGRLLLYWGCGAHAGPGQPVVIDFAKVAKGQMPPNLFSTKVSQDMGPQPGASRTYGDWPNAKDGKTVSASASLIGQHRVAGNYSPEMAFNLDQDFMAAMRIRQTPGADGSTGLSWNGLTNATGYYAWAMGGKDMGKDGSDMVWWASSATQDFGGGLWDWLSPATVGRLVGQKVVMPPAQTSCTVPAEVRQAAGQTMIGYLYAYGPEANFAFPERPRDPKVAWHPKWTAKVRYRSMAMMMLGMPDMGDMGDMMSGRNKRGEQNEGDQPQPKPCKPKLGGLLRSALGKKAC